MPLTVAPEVLDSICPYDPPPPDFNPLLAPDRLLEKYGLPARPMAAAESDLFAFWGKLLGPPLTIVQPRFPAPALALAFDLAIERIVGPEPDGSTAPPFSRGGRLLSSSNWSGAITTPAWPSRITLVAGAWSVPTVSLPDLLPSGVDPANEEFRSSTWIGIGGHRPFNSMPQIGTSQFVEVVGGHATITYGVWWQWWVKERTAYHLPVEILNMPVSPGDEMLALLTIESPGDAHFIIKNQTLGVLATFKVRSPGGLEPLGATAEWIHERPTKSTTRRRHPLPHFTDVTFAHCNARSAPVPGGPETSQQLDNARLIRMYEHFDAPFRSHFVSVPEKTGPTSLRIAFR